MSESPTLSALYDRYMECVEIASEAAAAARAAAATVAALPEYQAAEEAAANATAAELAMDAALDAVKAATAEQFFSTGDRHPHPHAAILRIDRRPRYNERRALAWLTARPDYRHLVVPESVNRRAFEKLARALDSAGMPPCYEDAGIDVPLIDWDEIPVVAVTMRPDE